MLIGFSRFPDESMNAERMHTTDEDRPQTNAFEHSAFIIPHSLVG